ncbi:MAG: hypothetical protein ACKN9W_03765 [Methylococcus sp.]
MQLEQLIDTFNGRFLGEYESTTPSLSYDGAEVQGRYGNLIIASHLKPIRLHADPSRISAYDTNPLVFKVSRSPAPGESPANGGLTDIVCLDRLGRTVHILNYLSLKQTEGYIFLHVHPQHVLAVKQNHGAYFEDIIRLCGLPVSRVVITLPLNSVYESQESTLLERLKTYRDRGYATAVKFEELAGNNLVLRFRNRYLHSLTPDFVRFNAGFFHPPYWQDDDPHRYSDWFAEFRAAKVRVMIEQILHADDAERMNRIQPDFVNGGWYEDQYLISRA